MSGGAPTLTARQIDAVRAWSSSGAAPDDAVQGELVGAGAIVGGGVQPTVASVVAVLERSWATFRVRRWRGGGRIDLAGAIGPAGVALLVGPHGVDTRLDLGHRPRWTAAARAIAGFVGLGPVTGGLALPATAPWAELVAAPGPTPPPWLPPVDVLAETTLWDLAWTPVAAGDGQRRTTLLDVGGRALVEATRRHGAVEAMTLTPRRADDVWFGLCHLLTVGVPAGHRPQTSTERGGG